jgi:hypothetical protein
VFGIIDSYQCRIVSPSSRNFSNPSLEGTKDYNYQQQQPQRQQSTSSDCRNSNPTTQSTPQYRGNSASSDYNPSPHQNQQQQSRTAYGRGGNHNIPNQPTHTKKK